jgi:hypothetical protein
MVIVHKEFLLQKAKPPDADRRRRYALLLMVFTYAIAVEGEQAPGLRSYNSTRHAHVCSHFAAMNSPFACGYSWLCFLRQFRFGPFTRKIQSPLPYLRRRAFET